MPTRRLSSPETTSTTNHRDGRPHFQALHEKTPKTAGLGGLTSRSSLVSTGGYKNTLLATFWCWTGSQVTDYSTFGLAIGVITSSCRSGTKMTKTPALPRPRHHLLVQYGDNQVDRPRPHVCVPNYDDMCVSTTSMKRLTCLVATTCTRRSSDMPAATTCTRRSSCMTAATTCTRRPSCLVALPPSTRRRTRSSNSQMPNSFQILFLERTFVWHHGVVTGIMLSHLAL